MSYRFITPIVLLLTLSVFCAACAFAKIDEPARAAEEWFVAVATMDALKADGLTCKAVREEFREDLETGSVFFRAAEIFIGPMEIEIDVSGVDITTTEQQGDWAIVTAKGEARAAVGGV